MQWKDWKESDIVDMIKEINREISMREYVYPRRVSSNHMSQQTADLYMKRIKDVKKILEELLECYKNATPTQGELF